MKNQNIVARARRALGVDAAQGMMTRTGNALARVLVGFADIDQNGALAHKLGGAGGRYRFQLTHRSLHCCSSFFEAAVRGSRCS